MIQETSRISYQELRGKLGPRQLAIYYAIRELGEATDCEIMRYLHYQAPNAVRPRRFELVERGEVVQAGKRKCAVTGKLAITWKIREKKEQLELWG